MRSLSNRIHISLLDGSNLYYPPIAADDCEREKEWMARVWDRRGAPGKFGREFAKRRFSKDYPGNRFYILLDSWRDGTPVEFRVDSNMSRTHNPICTWPIRWYGLIIKRREYHVVFYRIADDLAGIRNAPCRTWADGILVAEYLDDLADAMARCRKGDMYEKIVRGLYEDVRQTHPDEFLDWWMVHGEEGSL